MNDMRKIKKLIYDQSDLNDAKITIEEELNKNRKSSCKRFKFVKLTKSLLSVSYDSEIINLYIDNNGDAQVSLDPTPTRRRVHIDIFRMLIDYVDILNLPDEAKEQYSLRPSPTPDCPDRFWITYYYNDIKINDFKGWPIVCDNKNMAIAYFNTKDCANLFMSKIQKEFGQERDVSTNRGYYVDLDPTKDNLPKGLWGLVDEMAGGVIAYFANEDDAGIFLEILKEK